MRPITAAGIAVALVVGILSSQRSLAQSPSPTFEVATVKPNKDGGGLMSLGFEPGGRFRSLNAPLRLLIRIAYEVQDFQILGGPGWMSTTFTPKGVTYGF